MVVYVGDVRLTRHIQELVEVEPLIMQVIPLLLLLGAYGGHAYRLGLRSSLVMKDYPQPNVFDTVSDKIIHPVCTQ